MRARRRPCASPQRLLRWTGVVLLGLLWAAGCSLFTDFDPERYQETTPELCSDGVDNDGNGAVDCADSGCTSYDFCIERSDERCKDGVDNDADGKVDCQDEGCCPYADCHLQTGVNCLEQTQKACLDGVDNDDNGLTDCADFNCTLRDCCNELVPLLVEPFDLGEAGCSPKVCAAETSDCCSTELEVCNAFNSERWIAWGMPRPRLAGGELVVNQPCSACPASGVVSVVDTQLSPGLYLELEARVKGGNSDFLGAGLTSGEVVPQTSFVCGDITATFRLLTGVQLVGGKIQAVMNGRAVASLDATGDGSQRLGLSVAPDRTVFFYADGQLFYRSRVKITSPAVQVRLMLQGHGPGATVDNVLLARREGCRAPRKWVSGPIGPGAVLAPTRELKDFDSGRVANPSVVFTGKEYRLYYDGGALGATGNTSLGMAVSPDGQVWRRSGAKGLSITGETSSHVSAPCVIAHNEGYLMAYRRLEPADQPGGEPQPQIALASSSDGKSWSRSAVVLTPGSAGAWDDKDLDGPALARFNDLLYLWYSGRGTLAKYEAPALGLAISESDTKFNKHPQNPVLKPGVSSKDERGLYDPWILTEPKTLLIERGKYNGNTPDQRLHLWYVARTWAVETQLNYAVSEDGVRWVRYSDNPVVSVGKPGLFGDQDLRGPTVLERWGTRRMWYGGTEPSGLPGIGYAVSTPGQ